MQKPDLVLELGVPPVLALRNLTGHTAISGVAASRILV